MKVIARFKEPYSSFKAASSMEAKPSNTATSSGFSNTDTRVSGIVSDASLESTGLMQKALTASSSSFVRLPEIT